MDKNKLYAVKNIIEELDKANEELYLMIDLMNLTVSERERILDAMLLTEEKIKEIKQSKISELDQHVNFEYL